MSKILTRSTFYFGTTVGTTNYAIDFAEGGSELQATLTQKDYSLEEYAAEVQRAMRQAGTLAYIVTAARATRILTIAAPSNFSLKCNTGTRASVSAWSMMGFSTVSDRSPATSQAGNSGAGSAYTTQYPVGNYIAPTDSFVRENAVYDETSTGYGQLVSFGDGYRIRLNIRLITNILTIRNEGFAANATGVADFKTFIQYAIDKKVIEFIPNTAVPNTFYKVRLVSTPEANDGTAFDLKSMGVPDVHQSGNLVFRGVLQ